MIQSLLFKYTSVPLVLFITQSLQAQTVPDNVYLHDRINKASQSLNYDEITKLFESNPTFNLDCLIDENTSNPPKRVLKSTDDQTDLSIFISNGNNSEESILLFKDYLLQNPFLSTVQFNHLPSKYGFDLEIVKSNSDKSIDSKVFEFAEISSCSSELIGEQDLKKNCGSILVRSEKKITINGQGGDYDPQASKTEEWRTYYISESNLIATVSLSYEASSYSWTGSKSGKVSFSQNYICVLTREN